MKTKIEPSDTVPAILMKMSEGNPGAITVCAQILTKGAEIDPDDAMGGIGKILSLDTLGLYGSKIWMLFKDVCGQNIHRTLAVLRGWQLGFISSEMVRHAVDNRGEGLDLVDICRQVKERLPKFQTEQPE